MQVYNPADERHGLLVAQWWAQAKTSGDLALMTTEKCHSLPGFFQMVGAPNTLVFETDEQGITVAGWFEPTFSFCFFSLWVRPDLRTDKAAALASVNQMYELGFSLWPAILGVTKQERLLKSHEKTGYTIVGNLPGLFDGQDAWLVMLTKENFEANRRY